MNIRRQLLLIHSRSNADLIEAYVVRCAEALPELMACLLSDEVVVAQRAAMVVGNFGRRYPDQLKPWWSEIFKAIENPVHPAIARSGMRYFSELPMALPGSLESRLIGHCLKTVKDRSKQTATSTFAMQFIADRADRFGEAAAELNAVLIRQIPGASAGFQNRGKKVLQQLSKFL